MKNIFEIEFRGSDVTDVLKQVYDYMDNRHDGYSDDNVKVRSDLFMNDKNIVCVFEKEYPNKIYRVIGRKYTQKELTR